ncbi:hypothetical protein OCH239_20265 [Roseivivax halodurans JCM 10272]|uniref:Uncharacterized protein n=1 Tax=Roseivivax halodurans JCM 10272 TaxID=1449350 RepID=X7E5F0_9RHOB|nr:hypothetical protein [Roseivivax halodurans]ETX11192.1 hypothetical protein OCH239_20265 [Roseivivax halodurans JCM 10272]
MDIQQQIAAMTLGSPSLERPTSFSKEDFDSTPAFENKEIAFYQMKGLVFRTWLKAALEEASKMLN